MRIFASCLLGLTFFTTAAWAEQETREDLGLFFMEWRWIGSQQEAFPLNASGESSGLNWYLDQRLDLGGEIQVDENIRAGGEFEFFYGQVAGDADHVGAAYRLDARETLRGWDLDQAELRQLWVDWTTPWFKLKAGQMGSHWGLGLLARDGRSEPGRIGLPDQGDLSDRVLVATRPLKPWFPDSWPGRIVTALGGGLVYRDENCELRAGDLGGELLASIFYREPGRQLGMYVAGRLQDDDAGTELNVVVLDLFAQLQPPAQGSGPVAEAELAWILGQTDRIIQADHTDGVNISAFGGVARLGWQFSRWNFRPLLELGYASGDPDPHDDRISSFSFDPDYKVGLVLFDVVLRGVSAMAAEEAADPERVGQPLPGVDQLASRGRVSGATYLYPHLSLRPLEQLNLMAGLLVAWSTTDFAQSYQTFLAGGQATNPYGLTGAGRDLGVELDLGLDWTQPLWRKLALRLGLQMGWFFPGKAFERTDGSRPEVTGRVLAWAALVW